MIAEDNLNYVERLIAIYDLLKNTRKKIKSNELAKMYDVSIRTISRDIKKLKNAGVAVYGYVDGYMIIE